MAKQPPAKQKPVVNPKVNQKTQPKPQPKPPFFFISHSSKDKAIVEAFVEKILKLGLNVNGKNIFCSSISGMDIKSGEDFRRVIKSNLQRATAVIQIITKNYRDSEVCLNEMGAAWVLSGRVIPFIYPPISYPSVGFIHNPNQLLKLDEDKALHKFRDDHKDLFPRDFSSAIFNDQVKEFLKVCQQNRSIW